MNKSESQLRQNGPEISLSIIIPFYNEKNNILQLHKQLIQVQHQLPQDFELIYVNDGSTDISSQELESKIKQSPNKPHSTLITFRRNYGQTAAMMAGVDCARGRLIAFLDADLQNDPQDLPHLLTHIEAGYEAVFGWRKNRRDGFSRNISSLIANYMIRFLFKVPLHDVGCSLKVYRRELLENIHFYGETHRIMAVITYWRGAHIKEIPVRHHKRYSGKSKYGFSRVVKLIIDLTTIKLLYSYGTKPAYVFGSVGLFCIIAGSTSLSFVAYHKLFLGVYVHRDPLFLISIFLILLGVQFMLMGLLAELVIRTYYEVQHKPTYEIKKISRI